MYNTPSSFAVGEGIVSIQFGAGDFDGDPDGIWGHCGNCAYGS